MRKTIVAAALAAAITSSSAMAADLQPYSPYAIVPIAGYSWMGPYLGLNFGYQWGTATPTKPAGLAIGGQGGYNWQVGQFVYGVEADLQGSGANDTFAAWKFSNPWFGTARGRVGVAFNNILLYGTGGLAFGGGQVDLGGLSESNTHIGWALGGGMEVGFTPNWSAKVEYLYIDLSNQTYVLTGTNHGFQSNLLRFGINYRF
jgi:outer membrane immunogenic protein